MNKGDTFVFYPSFYEDLQGITDDRVKLRVYEAIICYGCYGIEADLSDIDQFGILASLVKRVSSSIDAAKEKRQRISQARSAAGKKGGAPAGNQNARKNEVTEIEETSEEQNKQMLEETNNSLKKQTNQTYNVLCNDVDNILSNDSVQNSGLESLQSDEHITPPIREKTDYEKVVGLWHEVCKSYPRVTKLTDKRKRKVGQRMKELDWDYGQLRLIFEKMEASSFMRGGSWASFDWVFTSEGNMTKVLEGNYDDKNSSCKPPQDFSMRVNDSWNNIDFDPKLFN